MSDTFTVSDEGPNALFVVRSALKGVRIDALPVSRCSLEVVAGEHGNDISLVADGEDPIADIAAILNVIENRPIESITVEAVLDDVPRPEPEESESASDSGEYEPNEEKISYATQPDEGEPGHIADHTLEHVALYLLEKAQRENDGHSVTSGGVSEATPDGVEIDKSHIWPSLTSLTKKQLVQVTGEEVRNGVKQYLYSITAAGASELDDVGEVNWDTVETRVANNDRYSLDSVYTGESVS